MTECSEARLKLHSWLDRELKGDEALDYQAHLDGCRSCADQTKDWARFIREMDTLPLWEEPESVIPAVIPVISAEGRPDLEEDSWLEPVILCGLFITCLVGLLRMTGRLLGPTGEHLELIHSPIGVAVAWAAVGLTLGGTLCYLVFRKRAHVNFL